jgi:hypothetical protein
VGLASSMPLSFVQVAEEDCELSSASSANSLVDSFSLTPKGSDSSRGELWPASVTEESRISGRMSLRLPYVTGARFIGWTGDEGEIWSTSMADMLASAVNERVGRCRLDAVCCCNLRTPSTPWHA